MPEYTVVDSLVKVIYTIVPARNL